MVDDLLIRVDAQVAEATAAFGKLDRSVLTLEATLKRASAQQELYQRQVARYGAESAQAQSALSRAQRSNAVLAEQAAARQAKAAAEQRTALQAQATAYSRLGRTYTTVGAGIVLALGASAKAAIDWEQDFARVRQALEGTPQQISAVDDGLRGLARTLPATHEALAGMAQAAAQTGVATDDIVGFTKVIAELATTAPDLQDGATELARFLNVTGTSTSQVENVASAMTKLGQAGASTVSEIADLGLRLAGAGRTAELSNGEILGFANAMTSLGLRVETAGTNFSKTLLEINTAVGSGGEKLRQFADIAGVSAREFAQAYQQDSAKAIVSFLDGLERIRKSGGDVADTLAGLGITSQRQIDVLNRLSQNTDLLNASLETGNQAYKDNTALQETFSKQAETTASRMQVAANNVHDLGISIGQTLLPPLGDAAAILTEMASVLGNLPGPVKDLAVVLGVATAAVTLFSGASLLMRARLLESRLALEQAGLSTTAYSKKAIAARAGLLALGIAVQQLGSKLADGNQTAQGFVDVISGATIGSAAGPWGALAGAIAGATNVLSHAGDKMAQIEAQAASLGGTLNKVTGEITAATEAQIVKNLTDADAYTLAEALGVSLTDVTLAAQGNAAAFDRVKESADGIAGDKLIEIIGKQVGAIQTQRDELDRLYQSQADAAGVTKSAASIQGDFATEIYGASGAMDTQKKSADAAKNAVASFNAELARFLGKQIGVHQAIIDSVKAAKEQADGFNLSKQAGIDNTQVLLNLQSALQNVDSTTKSGKRSFGEIAQAMVDFQHAQGRSIPVAKAHTAALLGVSAAAIDIDKHGNVTVNVHEKGADEAKGKIDSVKAALDLVDGMTANATVTIETILRTATSQQAAYQARQNAAGGYISGPGTSTSDSIPAMLSDGEFVLRAAAVQRIGVARLQQMNARGYAQGGYAAGGSVGGSVSVRELLAMLSGGAGPTLARVNALLAERNRLEDQEARALEHLRDVRKDSSSTDKQIADAEERLQKARDASSAATDKFKSALDALTQTIQARVDQITGLASAFGGEGTSLTAQGLLAKKRAVAADTKEFTRDLRIIKRKGADRDLIAEIRAEGPTTDALTLLRDLIRQPRSYFKAEARADAAVRRNAGQAATIGLRAHGGTTIGKQVNVHVHGAHLGPTKRELAKTIRREAVHALQIAGAS
jgi:TP901 family phage tail tape measure protein